jgi:hypothetical protein
MRMTTRSVKGSMAPPFLLEGNDLSVTEALHSRDRRCEFRFRSRSRTGRANVGAAHLEVAGGDNETLVSKRPRTPNAVEFY